MDPFEKYKVFGNPLNVSGIMKLANTQMLWLFWTVPFLVLVYWYGWRRRRKILQGFANQRSRDALVPQGLRARRRLKASLILLATLLLVLTAAGPQYGFHWEKVERRGVDLVIALDCSRSMLAQDIQPTRLDRAKREIVDLLAMLQGDRVGLVAFSGTAFLQCPLTMDYSAFDLFLNVLTPDYLPLGGTDMSAAVHTALNAFDAESAAEKAVILITDGENTGQGDPEEAAKAAQKAGIKLFCIGVGSADGVPVPSAEGGFKKDADGQIVLSRLDEPLLTRMAVATGGSYVRSVAGDMDLDVIYQDQIRGGMKQAALESGRKKVWAQRFQWPLAVAIVLLMTAWAVPSVKKTVVGLAFVLCLIYPQSQVWAGPMQKGYQSYQDGQYDEALKRFIEGQLKDPDNPDVLYNIGSAYYKSGDYKAAQEHFSQALSKASPELKAKLLYNLGNTAFRQKQLQEAAKDYEAALQLAPEDQQAKDNLAYVKKQIQQQQQQQNQQNDSQQDKQDQQDQQQDSDSSSASQNQNDQKDQSQQQAQQQDQNQQQQQGEQEKQPPESSSDDAQQASGADQNTESQPAEQAQASGKEEGQHGDQQQIPQPAAAQMLNRLKDEPGRAMMPRYQKMPVEKDW